MENDAELVRLQIPISRPLADKVGEYARKLERSQGWMAAKLIDLALRDLSQVGSWLRRRAEGKGSSHRHMGFLQMGDNSAVRLQVQVPAEVARKLNDLAARLNHTPVRMAALLLDFGVDDNKWFVQFMGNFFGRAVLSLFGGKSEPYASAEIENEE